MDECVDQKAVRAIPAREKGLDIVYPEDRSYKEAKDTSVVKLAQGEDRVLVTSDSDFPKLHVQPGDIPQGVLWLHPPRSSKKAINRLLVRFCRFRRERFSTNPCDFGGQIITIDDTGMRISTRIGTEFHPWPTDYPD